MKNWKTTLSGCALAVMYAVSNQPDWKHLVIAALFAIVGFMSKDFNVTGGTTLNTNAAPNTPVGIAPTAK